MARYGPPDDPNYSDENPTAYINFGNYGQQPPGPPPGEPAGPPPGEPVPWYRKPAALVAFGALGAVLVALIVYGLAKLITGDSSTDTPPTRLTPLTTASQVVTPTTTPVTETTTETTEPTTTTTTTTTEPTTTTATTTTTTEPTTTVSTSTSTVTETITVSPTETPAGN